MSIDRLLGELEKLVEERYRIEKALLRSLKTGDAPQSHLRRHTRVPNGDSAAGNVIPDTVAVLKEHGELGPMELAKLMGIELGAAGQRLKRCVHLGLVERVGRGQYRVVTKSAKGAKVHPLRKVAK